MTDIVKLEDRMQDLAEAVEDITSAIKAYKPQDIIVTPPTINFKPPDIKVDVKAPNISTPVTIEKINPTKWEFVVTQRDHNGRIEKFTATPIP